MAFVGRNTTIDYCLNITHSIIPRGKLQKLVYHCVFHPLTVLLNVHLQLHHCCLCLGHLGRLDQVVLLEADAGVLSIVLKSNLVYIRGERREDREGERERKKDRKRVKEGRGIKGEEGRREGRGGEGRRVRNKLEKEKQRSYILGEGGEGGETESERYNWRGEEGERHN